MLDVDWMSIQLCVRIMLVWRVHPDVGCRLDVDSSLCAHRPLKHGEVGQELFISLFPCEQVLQQVVN